MPGVRRIELVAIVAVALSLPSLVQAFNGGISIATAFVRLGIALVVCCAVGAIVERTIDNYARDARQREIERRVQQAMEARAAFWGDQRSHHAGGGPPTSPGSGG